MLLLGGIASLVGGSLWRQHRRDLIERKLVQMLPGVSQRIQDFRRVKMQDGRKVWEVAAADARYFEEQGVIMVLKPVVAWYLADGREVGMRGEQGRIRLEDKEIATVEVDGGIEVALADYRISTAGAIYNHGDGTISSSSPVEITGKAMDVRGDGMVLELEAQRMMLLDNVTMRLDPNQLEHGG